MRHWRAWSSRQIGVSSLAAATYGAVGLGLLTTVLLTRVMNPVDFGSYRYVITVVGLLAVVANFGIPYSAAYVLSKSDPRDQPRKVAASLQLMLVAVALVAVLLAVFALGTLGIIAVSPLLLMAAALGWTVALQRHFMYMLRGLGKINDIVYQTILPSLILLLSVVGFALLLTEVHLWMVLATSGCAYLLTHLWTSTHLHVWGERRLNHERAELMGVQRRTGVPIYRGALVSVGVAEAIVVVGGAFVGEREFGEFALALSLAAPVATLPKVLGMAQFRSFATQGRMTRRLLLSATYSSSLIAAVGVCVGWYVFPLIFPGSFSVARLMFPALAVGLLFHGLGDYLNQFLQAQGEGLRIKRAAYASGFVNIVVGVAAVPLLGIWGLVVTKIAGSVSFAILMLVLIVRGQREPK